MPLWHCGYSCGDRGVSFPRPLALCGNFLQPTFLRNCRYSSAEMVSTNLIIAVTLHCCDDRMYTIFTLAVPKAFPLGEGGLPRSGKTDEVDMEKHFLLRVRPHQSDLRPDSFPKGEAFWQYLAYHDLSNDERLSLRSHRNIPNFASDGLFDEGHVILRRLR